MSMKIKNLQAVRIEVPNLSVPPTGTRLGWYHTAEVANPMSRFVHAKAHRSLWLPKWEPTWCKVTLEDGTWGLGSTSNGRVSAAVIEDHLAPNLIGQDGFALEKLTDMMFRLTKPYGTPGLASYAISAVDLALWDAKGKALQQPVYSLLGGKHKEAIQCYATGNDIDWYMECGFEMFKLACPFGPTDGMAGLAGNEELVATARDQIGAKRELMLDCWMAFDVDYSCRLAHRLRPYGLKWMEECLLSEDLDAHLDLRQRLPWQALATGEHWYTAVPFQWAARHQAVDILQPDICWCGGLSTCLKIAAIAEAAGLSVILHGGGNNPFGQHFSMARANVPFLECFMGTDPGVDPAIATGIPGQARPKDGWLTLNANPGFGMEIEEEWIKPFFD